jgi:hypothetical protein
MQILEMYRNPSGANRHKYITARFMSIDPLAEKFPYNATYAFQENKMGLGRELEGLELVYRKNTSPIFKKKFAMTIQYMNNRGTSGMIAKLNRIGRTILIDNTGKGSYYKPSEQAIYWDPTAGIKTDKGHLLSPATVLNHEVDHALEHKINPKEFKKNTDSYTGYDPQYDTKEEKRVITISEQKTALKHGEIMKGEVTRTNHRGVPMIMPSPISTENAKEGEFNINLKPVIIDKTEKKQ